MPNSLYTTQPANQRPTGNLTMSSTGQTSNPAPTVAVPSYGSTVTDTMGRTGIAKYNPNTGALLNQSTTTLSSSNPTTKIPNIISNTNNYADKGLRTDVTSGTSTFPDGSIYNPEANAVADTSSEDTSIMDNLNAMRESLDSSTTNQIAAIQQQFAQRKAEQRDINAKLNKNTQNALLMGGATGQGSSAQYAPISSEGIVTAQESYGIKQIADLDNQENQLIMAAKEAQRTGDFRIMESINAEIEKKRQQKIEVATNLNKDIADRNNKLRENNLQIQKENAISELYSSGITDTAEIAKRLQKNGVNATVKEISDTTALLSGQGGSGIIGEYNYYKNDAIKRGQVPLSFDAYQTQDANRKKSIAAAGIANQFGLDKEQRTRVAGLLDDYDKQTKDKKTVINQSSQIDALSSLALSSNPDKGSRAAAQIGLIFSYMKMLDPTSTVREGEYATAQNTAGVDDKVRNAYNKVRDGSFLQDGQIKGYVSTGKALAESNKRQIEGIDKEFDRRSAIFGIPAGTIGTNAGGNTASDLVQQEDQAKAKIINYGKTNPKFQPIITKKINQINPITGQKYRYSELLEIYPEIQ